MFRNLRRTKQQLTDQETEALLERGSFGVLALLGDGDYPYALPLNYVLAGNHIYFHSAPAGHKIDAIGAGAKASFCVVEESRVIPEELTTSFSSAIAFGRVFVVEDEAKRREALGLICEKYAPGLEALKQEAIDSSLHRTAIIGLEIEHRSGKVSRDKMN